MTLNTMTSPRSIEELIAEIDECFVELDMTAAEAERLGTAPDELDVTIRRLRVPMIKAPVEVGGDHLLLADQFRYFEALSHANATAAWAGFNHAGAAGMAGAILGDEGLDALFGNDPSPVMAAVSAPSGTYRRVDGGVEVTGTWKYASGVRHADWAMLTALEADSAAPSVRLVVVRTADATIGTDWNVMALKGTGSVDVTVDGAFVPDALVVDPMVGTLRGGPMYRLGYQAYVSAENLGFTMGQCQRFLDELTTYACGKARGFDGRLADRGAFQYELGKGQLAVDAARAHGMMRFREADELIRSGHVLDLDEQRGLVAMLAYATEHATNAISHLFHFAGASAIFDSNVLQRCFRDAHGSVQHHVASNIVFDRFGRSLLHRVDETITP
jgi:alkylation response protein AidB-like acyl-CoA dehydrogenase